MADAFVTVGGTFLFFRSELRRILMLVDRYVNLMGIEFTESRSTLSVLSRLRGTC